MHLQSALGRAALALAIALLARGAAAGVYKCALDDGSVTYQENPCPAGKELRDFDRDPAAVSVIPFRIAPGPDTHVVAPRAPTAQPASERKSRKSAEPHGNPAERKFLVPGMSSGAGRKTMRWTYLPAPEDPQTITTLTFELGRLVEVERKVVRTP
jgi:hypothetical protein